MEKNYKKVVCIKVGKSLYNNTNCLVLELNKVYLVDENYAGIANGRKYFLIMRDDMTFGHAFDSEFYEW